MDGVFNWVESMTPDENTWLTDTPEYGCVRSILTRLG